MLPLCRFVAALGILLGIGPSMGASAQTGQDLLRFGDRDPGFSARTLGLAGATVGGLADWGAVVANPASIALARASHLTGSLDLTGVRSQAEFGDRAVAQSTCVLPGHAAYVAVLPVRRGSLALGIGYHRVASLGRRLFVREGHSGADFYESGWLSELSAAAAVEAAPGLFVGAAVGGAFGRYLFSEQRYSSLALYGRYDLESHQRGLSVRGGMVVVPAEGFRLGFSVESPTWLNADETFAVGTGTPDRITYSMQLPWRIAAGGAFQMQAILIAADVAFADWSVARLRPSHVFLEENVDIERNYRETIDARLGAEYDFGIGAVRVGFAVAQDPLRDLVEANRLRQTFASGLSFHLPRGITLDLGLAYTEFQDQVFFDDQTQPFPGQRVVENVGRFRALLGAHVQL